MKRAACLLLVLACSQAPAEIVRIHGVAPETIGSLEARYDFWGLDWRAGYAVFDVTQAQREALVAAGYDVETDPVRNQQLRDWMGADRAAGDPDTIPGFECYRSVSKTHADLAALAAAHPDRAEWIDIGDTWQAGAGSAEGGSLYALRIGNPDSAYPQAPLVIAAAQHARELVTAEIATRFAELLVTNPGDDPDIEWLLDHRAVHIIAQANPDGRRRVEAGDAMWRKNHDESACPGGDAENTWTGVDLNRNAAFLWEPVDSPCGQRYAGPAVASEPETTAMQDYLASVFPAQRPASDLVTPAPDEARGVFVSLHSFGDMVLIPWEGLGGGDENNAPNHHDLTLLGRRFGEATGFAVARHSLLPPATGTAVDYAYGEFGAAAYTFEVGSTFLQSCETFESDLWPAQREALLLAARAAHRPYREPSGPAIRGLAWSVQLGRIVVTGTADDGLYFDGGVNEPPQPNPVSDVVEIRVTPGVPPETGAPTWTFPVPAPADRVTFSATWPPGVALPANGRLFVTAVDATGQGGLARVVGIDELIHANSFEAVAE